MTRIVDPPREVPLGLTLAIVAGGRVTGSLFYFLPAAVALVAVALRPDVGTGWRVAVLLAGLILVALGYKTALPALLSSLATLRRMRIGHATEGCILSCHFGWDSARKQMPYRVFLEDWVVNVTQSQMGKFTGCLAKFILIVFGGPALVMVVLLGLAYVENYASLTTGGTLGGVTEHDVWAFVGMTLLTTVALVLMLAWLRRTTLAQTRQLIEAERQEARDRAGIDRHTGELIAQAREQAQGFTLKDPLPPDRGAVELICQVAYSAMGQPRTATSRVRFSNRLNLVGVELLLFDPLDGDVVELFAGLPAEASVDALGQWRDVAAGWTSLRLGLIATVVGVATATLLISAVKLGMTHGQETGRRAAERPVDRLASATDPFRGRHASLHQSHRLHIPPVRGSVDRPVAGRLRHPI